MPTHKRFKSTQLRSARVKEIIRSKYEPGVQAKCKLAIYRNYVFPIIGISERTFWRLMNEVEAELPANDDPNQLKLF